ncbi:MAG: hypothetical protein AAF635_15475 [Cyanobacteria bacterium P01_C01_bin.69]
MFKQANLAIAGAAAIVLSNANTTKALTLGEIQIGGGSFNTNGITYSSFSCQLTTSNLGSELLRPNSCDDIKVLNGGFNLAFQGPFSIANLGSSDPAFTDALIGFDIMFDDNRLVESLELVFNGAIQSSAFASVTETVSDINDNVIAQLSVTNSPLATDLQDSGLEPGDFNLLDPVSQLNIKKRVLLQAESGGSARISLIGQNYEAMAVPKPISALPIVAMGAVATGNMVFRQKT